MSQQQKSAYWKALKGLGVTFDEHYREYSTEQLAEMYSELTEGAAPPQPAVKEEKLSPPPPAPPIDESAFQEFLAWKKAQEAGSAEVAFQASWAAAEEPAPQVREPVQNTPSIPRVNRANPDELPGERLNSKAEDEPIRIDDAGRVWYQEEVRKGGYARPRGRRVLKYLDSGVETKQVQNGDYVESFEVGGRQEIPSEVKITLPSYQVGIFKDPRMPFRINVYNGQQGFDLLEVQKYYGGSEMVPAEIKRIYVSNVLCYDIRTTIRAIETEARRLQLKGMNL